jgi:HSP20 family protein
MWLIPYTRRTVPVRRFSDPTRVLENFFDDFLGTQMTQQAKSWTPAVDILEKDGDLIVRAELPGVQEKDIDLKLEGNVLTLKGERRMEDEQDREDYHRVESFYGSFARSFTVPDTADLEKISADYKNGVLTVKIPQRPEVKPREIQISAH